VAVLLEAAARAALLLTDATNNDGMSAALIATERGHAMVLGVLAQGGADLRVATPTYYCTPRPGDPDLVDRVDPNDAMPVHRALDMAVRSYVSKTCCSCGLDNEHASLSRCSKCDLAYFCTHACLKAAWKSHKLACKPISAGRGLLTFKQVPSSKQEITGFDEPFGKLDQVADRDEVYDRERHANWQYDVGRRGHPQWQRYPARIESMLESMSRFDMGHMGRPPKFIYRPGRPANDGMYEKHGRSVVPPSDVATCFVTFDDMTEREVYTGASRAVRRNGVRVRPPPFEKGWAD